MSRFAAIDFETATYGGDSACALAATIVEDGVIVQQLYELIRPPTRQFSFTHIHGLCWDDVKHAPDFAAVWECFAPALRDVEFLAAHNAPFDQGVLNACCNRYGLAVPPQPFVCTVQLARAQWDIRPTKLPDVCRYLGIELVHHQADSDAAACARIVIAAEQEGWRHERRGQAPMRRS